MKIGAISPWFGSKRNLASEIIRELGQHCAYWEPFCGSLAVLLAKEPCVMETANDLHGDLINLARVVACEETAVVLYGRLSRHLMHEDLFRESAERVRERGQVPADVQPDLQRAFDYMISAWCGRNGVAGTQSYNQGFCLRFTRNGGDAATRWKSVVESVPDWHERLRNVTILNRDGFDLLERIDDEPKTAIYVDPPYIVKGAKYVFDFTGADHYRLAAALGRFEQARVVVSYYDHELLSDLYPRWTKRIIEVTKSLANHGLRDKRGPVKVNEVLLVNRPIAKVTRQLFGAETDA